MGYVRFYGRLLVISSTAGLLLALVLLKLTEPAPFVVEVNGVTYTLDGKVKKTYESCGLVNFTRPGIGAAVVPAYKAECKDLPRPYEI